MAKSKTKTKVKVKKKAVADGKKLVGKTSGTGVLATWSLVFAENEKKKLSNEKILSRMRMEFPGYEAKSKIFSNVTAHRRFYNNGILTGSKPKVKSIKCKVIS